VACSEVPQGIYAIATTDGVRKEIVLANLQEACEIEFDLPAGFYVSVLDADRHLEKTDWNPNAFTLEKDTVAILKNY
jgi:hypothetical protein